MLITPYMPQDKGPRKCATCGVEMIEGTPGRMCPGCFDEAIDGRKSDFFSRLCGQVGFFVILMWATGIVAGVALAIWIVMLFSRYVSSVEQLQ